MKDVGRILRNADPLAREGELPPSAVTDMRHAIVAAARGAEPAAAWWPRPILVAATVAITLVAGVTMGRWLPWRNARPAAVRPEASSAAVSAPRRQLQFATPGGTRIIWVFDPDFNP
jgi:hypothetical protein